MCKLTEGLCGKLEIGETEGGTDGNTEDGGGRGGGGGGGGGVAFLRSGEEEADRESGALRGRILVLAASFGVEKSSNISAAS